MLGRVGNPSLGNLNIAKGCNRMVERSRGHMGHIEGHFRDLFPVHFLRRTFRKMGTKCPMCPQGKTISEKIIAEQRDRPNYQQDTRRVCKICYTAADFAQLRNYFNSAFKSLRLFWISFSRVSIFSMITSGFSYWTSAYSISL